MNGNNFGGGSPEKHLGVAPDYINAWTSVSCVGLCWEDFQKNSSILDKDQELDSNYFELKVLIIYWKNLMSNRKILTYGEYFSKSNDSDVVGQSDPMIVSAINSLVDMWNINADEIIKNKRFDLIGWYYDSIDNLVRGSGGKPSKRR